MEMQGSVDQTSAEESDSLGDLAGRLSEVVKAIARDELALARAEIAATAQLAVRDSMAIVLGGLVAAIGLGLLCVAAVAGLEPVIEPLWLRMIIMAAIYLAGGAGLAALFARRLRRDVSEGLRRTREETMKTAEAVKEALDA